MKRQQALNENDEWMSERWDLAKKEKESGETTVFPEWFFNNATERQLQKIEEIGLKISGGLPSKGEASDIIGLFEPIEDENETVLKFFKIPLRKMNQSRARYEVEKIFKNTDNVEKWQSRPASSMQKEFYKFFSMKAPQGITYEEASKFIREHLSTLSEEDESKADEWNAYEDLYDEINDPDYREDYELKKISLSLYRKAVDMLKSKGKTIVELSEDPEIVVDKIIEIKPEMQKSSNKPSI